jgi:hypothetical protein
MTCYSLFSHSNWFEDGFVDIFINILCYKGNTIQLSKNDNFKVW